MQPEQSILLELLESLRKAGSDGPEAVESLIRESTRRLGSDPEYAAWLRDGIRDVLRSSNSTHLLTEGGILADETLFAGTTRRLGAKVAPAPPRDTPLDGRLEAILRGADHRVFATISLDVATQWVAALLADTEQFDNPAEWGSALVILATRIAGDGLDARLTERLPSLQDWQSPFIELSRDVDNYADRHVNGSADLSSCDHVLDVVDRCCAQVTTFRERKQTLGTSLHLSSSSLRMQQQLARLRLLLLCTRPADEGGAQAIAKLALELLSASSRPYPTVHFIAEKLDLLSYLVVGHAAQKGARYSVRSRREFVGFLKKSLIGGVIVAVFALLKIHLSHEALAPLWQALVYGLNYAVCFVAIYLFGGTLATKQPALTASRLAAALEEGAHREDFPYLVRAIWRSQFISFVGNISGAAVVALLVAWAFAAATGSPLVSLEEARYLANGLDPIRSGSLFYAGVAGVMLSLAGLIAGFIDNAVIFHRLGDRMRAGTGVFALLPSRIRSYIAGRVDKELGEVSGNVALGFMLGSAGTIGLIVGLPFDIRHIAFASSHGALALVYAPELTTWLTGLGILVSVLMIGVVNFLVSFALTLVIAITSHQVDGIDWRSQWRALWRLLREQPLQFFVPLTIDTMTTRLEDVVDNQQGSRTTGSESTVS